MATTHRVMAGGVPIGGGAPVTIQSMTNTDTADAAATIAQISRLEQAGCEIVRASVYNEACAKAIPAIKAHISIPLVADIHFDYKLAIAAMESGVDKLRLNPGNIGGAQRVREVVACARAHAVPIRIGVNAGSMEPDILARDGGPSPKGMVESALRHVAILEREGFCDIVLSLKASNVRDTVEAYRLMRHEADYPLHIGVTEAGAGEAALVKSAMGIGALLLDGIGDTLRVSITGDPVKEVEAAKLILAAAGLRKNGVEIVSCPTCGRTTGDLTAVVERVRAALSHCDGYLKVAVMGCVVNGLGEGREADVGVAFAKGGAVVFKNGRRFANGPAEDMVALLIAQAKSMLGKA